MFEMDILNLLPFYLNMPCHIDTIISLGSAGRGLTGNMKRRDVQATTFHSVTEERAGDAAPNFSVASSWRTSSQDDSKAVEYKIRKRKKGKPSANNFIHESFCRPQSLTGQKTAQKVSHTRKNISRQRGTWLSERKPKKLRA